MVRVRKFGVIVFGVVATLALAWPSFARAADPPPVLPGTAKSNCERITEAGFSPHDYVLVATDYYEYTIKTLDYFHVVYNHLPVLAPNQPLSLGLALGSEQGNGNHPPSAAVREGFLTTKHESPDNDFQGLGVLTDGHRREISRSQTQVQPGDIGNLDAYTWTPDGGSPVVYRDQTSSGVTAVTEWFYNPEWTGPEDARMSSIWGGTPACVS